MGGIIEVENLTKRFDAVTAVDGISFTVGEGDLFAFLDPTAPVSPPPSTSSARCSGRAPAG